MESKELKKLKEILPLISASYAELAIERMKNSSAPKIPIFNTKERGASSLLTKD